MASKSKGETAKGGQGGGALVGVVIATLIAAGGGSYLGLQFSTAGTPAEPPKDPSHGTAKADAHGGSGGGHGDDHGAAHGKGHGDGHGGKQSAADHSHGTTIKPLPQIITNLAGPGSPWLRLEASIIVPPKPADAPDAPAEMTSEIGEDIIAFLRTVSVAQIQGSSGFQHLREDLNDRVRIRTNGAVNELIIHTLILE